MSIQEVLSYIETVGEPVILACVVVFLFWYVKKHDKANAEAVKRIDTGDTEHASINEKLDVIGRISLRQEIMNDQFPIYERMKAYDQYINEFKGNGYMVMYHETVLKPLAELDAKGENPNEYHRRRKTDTE